MNQLSSIANGKSYNKKRLAMSVLGAAVVLGVGYFAYTKYQAKAQSSHAAAATTEQAGEDKAAKQKPALTVEAVQASAMPWDETLSADGKIAPWQEASISAQGVGLKIGQVHAQVGEYVRAGKPLVTFESTTAAADTEQLKANVKEAQAAYADAQINYDKAKDLKEAGAISDQQYRQFKTQMIAAQARVEGATAGLSAGKTRNTLIAPKSGVISYKMANVGAVVQPGQELFRLVVDNRLEWQAELTAAQLKSIRVGMPARILVGKDTQITGVVRRIAPVVNAASNTATVFVDISSGQNIHAGMSAKGQFILGNGTAVTLPQTAVMQRDGFYYVYRINAESKVTQLKVSVGSSKDGRVSILSGVAPEDVLVASGVEFLKEGDLVQVAQMPVPANTDLPSTTPTDGQTQPMTNPAAQPSGAPTGSTSGALQTPASTTVSTPAPAPNTASQPSVSTTTPAAQ